MNLKSGESECKDGAYVIQVHASRFDELIEESWSNVVVLPVATVYRMLTGQGPAAMGGAYDYVVNDKLLGGFGIIAFPAEYGNSGVMTFIVNHDGVVYSRDLGPDTTKLAMAIEKFDPVAPWKREEPVDPAVL